MRFTHQMFRFQTAAATAHPVPVLPRKRRSPICCTATSWSSASPCLVWIRTASERRWTCDFVHQSLGGKRSNSRYHLKILRFVLNVLFVSLRNDVTMLSLVSRNCLMPESWWSLLVSCCIHSLCASTILKQVQIGPDLLDLSHGCLRCWLRLTRTKRSGHSAVMEQQCWWNQGVRASAFDMILHRKTLWRCEEMRTIELGFEIDFLWWYRGMNVWLLMCDASLVNLCRSWSQKLKNRLAVGSIQQCRLRHVQLRQARTRSLVYMEAGEAMNGAMAQFQKCGYWSNDANKHVNNICSRL